MRALMVGLPFFLFITVNVWSLAILYDRVGAGIASDGIAFAVELPRPFVVSGFTVARNRWSQERQDAAHSGGQRTRW